MDKALNCSFSVVDLSLRINGSIPQVELPITVYTTNPAPADGAFVPPQARVRVN